MTASYSESKLIRFLRTILSFLLAIDIAVVGMAFCFSTNFLNSNKIEKCFNDYSYISGVRENIISYVDDAYLRNGLDSENIDEIISVDAVKNVVEGYTGYYISQRVGFDENLYIKSITSVCDNLKLDIKEQIKLTNQTDNDAAVEHLVRAVSDYFINEINISGINYLETLLNVGIPASYGVLGVSLFLFVAIGLILIFLGEKNYRYRSISAVSISFLTAGFFEIFLAGIVLIISNIKKFDIYPIYLYDSFMHYFYTCVLAAAVAGLLLIVVSLAVSTLAWINKSKIKG